MKPAALVLALLCFLPAAVAAQDHGGAGRPAPTPDGWRADLDSLEHALRTIHPDAYAHPGRARFDSAFAAARARLGTQSDPERAIEFMRLTSIVQDGHTGAIAVMPQVGFHHWLPLRLCMYDDGLHVYAAGGAYAKWAGAKVLEVGTLPADQAWSRVLEVSGGDNVSSASDRAPLLMGLPEALVALGIAKPDAKARVHFVLEGRSGRHDVDVEPVPATGMPDWYFDEEGAAGGGVRTIHDGAGAPEPLHRRDPGRAWWYTYLPERRMIYFQFRQVNERDNGRVFKDFVAEMFAFADSAGAENLVIDLRHNGGGNNGIVQPLIHALIRHEGGINSRGHLFTVIGRTTFSAAMNTSNWLEEHTHTLFVGEPTGGRPNHFGDATTVTLPATGIRVRISKWRWQARWPWDERPWIAPQIAAPPTAALDRENRDPALEAIFARLDGDNLEAKLRPALLAGDSTAADAAYAAYLTRHPDRWGTKIEGQLEDVARALADEGQPRAALLLLRINVARRSDEPRAWRLMGFGALEGDLPDEAMAAFQKVLALDPGDEVAPRVIRWLTQRAGGGRQ